jgi:hypothetical protein
MRRLLLSALAALMLLPAVAGARILVITEKMDSKASTGTDTQTQSDAFNKQQDRMIGACVDVFNTTGVSYDMVQITSMANKWIKDGKLVRSYRSSGGVGIDSSYTQYDGVIILNALGRAVSNNLTNQRPWPPSQIGCYPCSLTRAVTMYPRRPVLFLFGAMNAAAPSQTGGPWGNFTGSAIAAAAACSTGASHAAGGNASPDLSYSVNDKTRGWLSPSNIITPGVGSSGILPSVSATAGGVRPLLLTKSSPYHVVMSTASGRVSPAWADSFRTGGGADTASVWERLMTGWAGTTYNGESIPSNARLVFANVMGASPCVDSISGANLGEALTPCEFDAPTLLFALAHLDSLTGGKVWESSTSKLPLRAAVTIDGAFTRTGRQFAGGTNITDSTVVKASLDSLAALGIPVTVGVNVDSIAAYPYEVAWWNKLPTARFTPQAWVGVDRHVLNPAYQSATSTVDTSTFATTVGTWTTYAGGSTYTPLVDIFGRFRNRAFYGDSSALHTVAGSDSSIYQQLLAGRQVVNTYWPNKVSGLLLAPRDAYRPKNFNSKTGGFDSLAYVVRLAGFIALRTDVQAGDADPSRWRGNRLLIRGGYPNQGVLPNNLGTTEGLRMLGQSGHSISGSFYDAGIRAINPDTAAAITEFYGSSNGHPTPPIPSTIVARFWHGFVHDRFTDDDWFPQGYNVGPYQNVLYPLEDNFSPMRRASILKLHVSDFGGISGGPPKRPGWWAVKGLANSFAAINAKAGRAVVVLSYPEEIVP